MGESRWRNVFHVLVVAFLHYLNLLQGHLRYALFASGRMTFPNFRILI